jgi:DNA-binding MarR family transcriptional regulator
MTSAAQPPELLFGDLLARARRVWVQRMSLELAQLGFLDYRRSDALAMRVLNAGPLSIGEASRRLGVSRQIARQIADGLHNRGYATTARGTTDRRRVEIRLTPAGALYARAVIDVIAKMNAAIAQTVDGASMDTARFVLNRVINSTVATAGESSPNDMP